MGHEGRHFKYQARLCPWPCFLARTSDRRIFQGHAVADFEFVARLLADEGLYWQVRHGEGRQTLVLQPLVLLQGLTLAGDADAASRALLGHAVVQGCVSPIYWPRWRN